MANEAALLASFQQAQRDQMAGPIPAGTWKPARGTLAAAPGHGKIVM
jgi:hypothetical protein